MSVEENRPVLLEDAEVIRVEKEKRNKKIIVAVLTTVVTVGLCLGIALPLTLSTSNTKSTQLYSPASRPEKNHSSHNVTHKPTVKLVQLANDLQDDTNHDDKTTTEASSDKTTTHHFTWPMPTIPQFCAHINTSKVNINLENWLNVPLYEVARIQTYGGPTFVKRVACSALKITQDEGVSYNFVGSWEEGGHRAVSRCSKTVKGTMNPTGEKYHFDVYSTEPEEYKGIMGEFTAVFEIEDYLLTYECFPQRYGDFLRGYSIYIYRKKCDTPPDESAVRLLVGFANVIGLNPLDNEVELVPQECLDAPMCEEDSEEDQSH